MEVLTNAADNAQDDRSIKITVAYKKSLQVKDSLLEASYHIQYQRASSLALGHVRLLILLQLLPALLSLKLSGSVRENAVEFRVGLLYVL